MAGITLEQAEARLALYLAAEEAVLSSQSYEIEGRKLTRADLSEIRTGIELWDARVQKLTNRSGGSRGRGMPVTKAR